MTNENDNGCLNCKRKSPIFDSLTESQLKYLSENRYSISYKTGELIYKQGTKNTNVISFTSGLAQIEHTSISGKTIVLRLVKPTEFITGLGVFLNDLHHFSVKVLQPSTVCIIELNVFRELLDSNRKFALAYIGEQNKHHIFTFNRLVSYNLKNREGRIAELLLYLSEDIYESEKYKFDFSKQLIADMTGMTRAGVFSILKKYQSDGLIHLSNGDIEIFKPERLKEISDFG
ncbi:MAG: Crp/Fnr family transcriptional regulator [Bacteroidetes bacterium]|nr:Crp/Fnr family transcriptional regulator [Bacteroidota bacterium]